MTMTYNPQDHTVTVSHRFGDEIESETIHFNMAYARYFVIEHLSQEGRFKSVLNSQEQDIAYNMCDGFGDAPRHYDWSHVRDSSYSTMWKVADWIASERWAKGSIKAHIDDLVQSALNHGIDPVALIS